MKIIDSHLHFCPGYPHFDEIAIEAGHINNEEHLRECFQKYNIVGGIVMGKYLAALTLYTIGLAIIFVYALILSFFGAVAWGVVISNILALFLLGAAFIAVTLFISSLTENQVVAAVLGMIVLLALALIDVVARYAENIPVVPTVLNALSFYTRYYDFTAGLFDPAGVLFYVSTAVIFNFFTVRVFEKRRWS